MKYDPKALVTEAGVSRGYVCAVRHIQSDIAVAFFSDMASAEADCAQRNARAINMAVKASYDVLSL